MSNGHLDIRALLKVALEEKPADDLADRVMARIAAMATVGEVLRLLTDAPVQSLIMAFGGDLEPVESAPAPSAEPEKKA